LEELDGEEKHVNLTKIDVFEENEFK